MLSILFFMSLAIANVQPAEIINHDMDVALDLQQHIISVQDNLTVEPHGRDRLVAFLNGDMKIESVTCEGRDLTFQWVAGDQVASLLAEEGFDASEFLETFKCLDITLPASGSDSIQVKITYSGVVFDQPKASTFNRQAIADQTSGLISEDGVYVAPSTGWYLSQPDKLIRYTMRITVPADYEVMSEGNILAKEEEQGHKKITFGCEHPFDGVHIIAGKFVVETVKNGDVDVMTYFFPGSEKLSPQYLQMSKRYLEMYEEMLGPYPFGKFAVVENFFPSGYGMPSYTLLGSEVIRLPFIVFTSLGHEVLHNWWGNSVYVNYKSGNWCEGLTTYGADYHYLELKDPAEAAEYRRNTNRDYTNYVNEGNDFALKEFRARHDASTRTVGYGKTMMVFHTIRRYIGDENFFASLKEFYKTMQWKEASWDDLLAVFEKVGGKPMGWIKEQYIERPGAPMISISNSQLSESDHGYALALTLKQEKPLYTLDVPVYLFFGDDHIVKNAHLAGEEETFKFDLDAKPTTISVDPDSELFRRMHREEIPPVLSQVFGGPDQLIVLPSAASPEMQTAYESMAEALNTTKVAMVKKADEVTNNELVCKTIYLLGNPDQNPLVKKWMDHLPNKTTVDSSGFTLLGKKYEGEGKALVSCMRNPANKELGAVLIMGTDPATVSSLGRRLLHYGKYSYLSFDGGQNVDKGIWPVVKSPLIIHLDSK